MGKEKIKKIFSLLDGKPVKSGKTIQFSKNELSTIKSFCFSSESKPVKKKTKKKKSTSMSKRETMLKNLAKARRARKANLKKKQLKKGKK